MTAGPRLSAIRSFSSAMSVMKTLAQPAAKAESAVTRPIGPAPSTVAMSPGLIRALEAA